MEMEILLSALLIFGLRIVDVSLAIARVLMVMRGRRREAWVFGFFQALVFVGAISRVLTDLDNVWNIIGYSVGFATGTVVGSFLEEKMAIGFGHIRIISPRFGEQITAKLRESGFAVTLVPGRGRDGAVDILNCSAARKNIPAITRITTETDPDAFITVENVQPLHKGFWGS
jgi:uncharacterized protein YebE (UPF0316 family)